MLHAICPVRAKNRIPTWIKSNRGSNAPTDQAERKVQKGAGTGAGLGVDCRSDTLGVRRWVCPPLLEQGRELGKIQVLCKYFPRDLAFAKGVSLPFRQRPKDLVGPLRVGHPNILHFEKSPQDSSVPTRPRHRLVPALR